MTSMSSGNAEQYSDSRKLAARGRLFSQSMVAETPWFEWVARRLPLAVGNRLLDIGCGPAWFWASAAPHVPAGLDLTLADLSPGMVEEAVARCAALPFASVTGRTADAASLPFADESFDLVLAMHMLYHVADPAAAIAEAHRVLRPGGALAVTTNGIGDMRAIYELTTVFGGSPVNPAALAFGFEDAERSMGACFGAVETAIHPASMRVADPEDVILAMTSFPPGDRASETELAAFRASVEEAFARGGGVLACPKETGLFISRKAA